MPCVTNFLRTIIINSCRLAAAQLLVLCALPAAAAADTHAYVVRVDPGLRTLQVEARFAQAVDRISARSRDAERFIRSPRACTGLPLRVSGRRLLLPDGGIRCLRYDVDLVAASRAERRSTMLLATNVVAAPAVWLWRPPSGAAALTVRFDVDAGTAVSVPWLPLDPSAQLYRIARSPGSAAAPAVFGRFDTETVAVAGAELRIAMLRSAEFPARWSNAEGIVDWLRDTAATVARSSGRLPNPSLQVVLFPVAGRNDSAVSFGRVLRDGGETIELYLTPGRPMAGYYSDWTATHEFSHLMLPYLSSRHRWISEGFAQYYQNLLLARAGRYSEAQAWQKLYEGFERGRVSGPGVTPNEASAGKRGAALMKVYWTGAVLALMADVELRRRSGGRDSLDSVLAELADCCLPGERTWSGTELFQTLDSFLDEPLFMPLYRRYADAPAYPDVRPTLARLGVTIRGGTLRLDPDAELADVRQAIMQH